MSVRVARLADGRKAIIIRTSDRIAFKQCRRKWGWSSHLKENLGSKYLASPLWFGSAIHFALEDFHGYNKFGKPSRAFMAYCIATSKQYSRDLPDDAQELYNLGVKMMDYYVDYWLRYRKPTPTFWHEGSLSARSISRSPFLSTNIPYWRLMRMSKARTVCSTVGPWIEWVLTKTDTDSGSSNTRPPSGLRLPLPD